MPGIGQAGLVGCPDDPGVLVIVFEELLTVLLRHRLCRLRPAIHQLLSATALSISGVLIELGITEREPLCVLQSPQSLALGTQERGDDGQERHADDHQQGDSGGNLLDGGLPAIVDERQVVLMQRVQHQFDPDDAQVAARP